MKYKGIIKDFEKIVVSDAHYLQDVWCRYDKTFNKKEYSKNNDINYDI